MKATEQQKRALADEGAIVVRGLFAADRLAPLAERTVQEAAASASVAPDVTITCSLSRVIPCRRA